MAEGQIHVLNNLEPLYAGPFDRRERVFSIEEMLSIPFKWEGMKTWVVKTAGNTATRKEYRLKPIDECFINNSTTTVSLHGSILQHWELMGSINVSGNTIYVDSIEERDAIAADSRFKDMIVVVRKGCGIRPDVYTNIGKTIVTPGTTPVPTTEMIYTQLEIPHIYMQGIKGSAKTVVRSGNANFRDIEVTITRDKPKDKIDVFFQVKYVNVTTVKVKEGVLSLADGISTGSIVLGMGSDNPDPNYPMQLDFDTFDYESSAEPLLPNNQLYLTAVSERNPLGSNYGSVIATTSLGQDYRGSYWVFKTGSEPGTGAYHFDSSAYHNPALEGDQAVSGTATMDKYLYRGVYRTKRQKFFVARDGVMKQVTRKTNTINEFNLVSTGATFSENDLNIQNTPTAYGEDYFTYELTSWANMTVHDLDATTTSDSSYCTLGNPSDNEGVWVLNNGSGAGVVLKREQFAKTNNNQYALAVPISIGELYKVTCFLDTNDQIIDPTLTVVNGILTITDSDVTAFGYTVDIEYSVEIADDGTITPVDLSDYYTKTQTNVQITNAVSTLVTQTNHDNDIADIEQDLSLKYDKTGGNISGSVNVIKPTADRDNSHLTLVNTSLTGKDNNEQRSTIWLDNNGNLMFRCITGNTVIRNGSDIYDLAVFENAGDLRVKGDVYAKGVKLENTEYTTVINNTDYRAARGGDVYFFVKDQIDKITEIRQLGTNGSASTFVNVGVNSAVTNSRSTFTSNTTGGDAIVSTSATTSEQRVELKAARSVSGSVTNQSYINVIGNTLSSANKVVIYSSTGTAGTTATTFEVRPTGLFLNGVALNLGASTVVDTVADSNLNAVTSNAVYDFVNFQLQPAQLNPRVNTALTSITGFANDKVLGVNSTGSIVFKDAATGGSNITVDQTVIDGSTNAVSGEGVKTYVDNAISSIPDIDIDQTITDNSTNAASSEAVKTYVDTAIAGLPTIPTVDQTIIDNSTKAASSEAVKNYVDSAISSVPVITVDPTVVVNSVNAVSGGGVKTYVDALKLMAGTTSAGGTANVQVNVLNPDPFTQMNASKTASTTVHTATVSANAYDATNTIDITSTKTVSNSIQARSQIRVANTSTDNTVALQAYKYAGATLIENTFDVKPTGSFTNNDVEILDTTKGIVLTAPDGGRWRVTVDNNGSLTTTKLT